MRKFTQIFSTLFVALFGFACARQDALYKAICFIICNVQVLFLPAPLGSSQKAVVALLALVAMTVIYAFGCELLKCETLRAHTQGVLLFKFPLGKGGGGTFLSVRNLC